MARIRTIKPAFFRHDGLFDAEKAVGLPLRVAFAGLWTAADREGRFAWKPRELKLDCLPFDDVDFSHVLDALATHDFIVKYASGGKEYGFIPSWRNHQVINNRETASSIPQPTENETRLTRAPRVPDACATPLVQGQGEGKGREGKGRERNGDAAAGSAVLPDTVIGKLTARALFKMFCDAYPAAAIGDRHLARATFDNLVNAGADADKIIADAKNLEHRDGPLPPASDWLCRWAEPKPAPPATAAQIVSLEAMGLASSICAIVGHDPDFPPPAWMGAPYRIQQWISQGWAEGVITASVKEQVARKRGPKIERIEYFEKGIADAVARANAPVPAGNTNNSRGVNHAASQKQHSAVAAIDRVFARLGTTADQAGDHSAGTLAGPDEDAVLCLPTRPVR